MTLTVPVVAFVVCTLILTLGWYQEWEGLHDRGDGQPRPLWDHSSWFHAIGCAGITFVIGVVSSCLAGVIVAMATGFEVEAFQRWPRDNKGGYWEWTDIFIADLSGATFGALLCLLLVKVIHG